MTTHVETITSKIKNDPAVEEKSQSLWLDAWERLSRDKLAVMSLTIVGVYTVLAILSAFNIVGAHWSEVLTKASYQAPSFESLDHILGTDLFGQSVFQKCLHGIYIAMTVGFFASIIAIPIGLTLGAIAGYFGGRVDEFIVWLNTTVTSIPWIMLITAIAYVMGKGLGAVCWALGLSGWVGLCRYIRAEVMKHKEREYVQAADAIGASHFRKIFIHILPNVMHIVIITFSLSFQTAIKSEVILSYLGLGVQGEPSWGTMIDESKNELLRGVWWQLAGATGFMFLIVLAFNLLGDALRDALDPKLKGKD